MTDVQFSRYNNIITFAKDWRKYKIQTNALDATAFRTKMQTDSYVELQCIDTKKNTDVFIYLFDKNSKYASASQDLKRFLKKIKHACSVILITYEPFNTYGRKAIATFKHLNIFTYNHEIFELVLPHGPLCYPHRILSHDEVLKLCNEDLMCYLNNLPKIFDEDPQCIWIGAESGDVVEVTMNSDISGEFVQYRVVVPRSGRVVFSKEPVEEKVPDDIEEDDELAEHRELNVSDADDGDDVEDNAPDDTETDTEAAWD
jgi:DNA-directed RNA polymerase subunit H (RpoH/RPB5)